MDLTRPTWLEIDLDALDKNYEEIRRIVPAQTDIMAVVKADGYGLGAVNIVKALMDKGVKRYGVATLSEALNIKNKVPHAQILVLGYTPEYLAKVAIENNIRLTVYLKEQADYFNNIAKELEMNAVIHIKIETGMNRLGFPAKGSSIQDIKDIKEMENLIVEGIFTHFPDSEYNEDYTRNSMKIFNDFLSRLEALKINIPLKHANNSAAIMSYPEYSLDMVRAGIIIYGLYPYPEVDKSILTLKPCFTLKSQVAYVKTLSMGEKIGYGLTYETTGEEKIATLPIGYGDGYRREFGKDGYVLIKGEKAKIVGLICMDQLMVNVTGIDVKRGDEVVLIGKQEDQEISIEELSSYTDQSSTAILSMLTRRVPRVYVKNRRIPEVVDYLL